MSPAGWVADCVPGQEPLGPGHGTFVGGCVCCGSGGCSVVPIGSSNRGLGTPQPEGMRTRGEEEGMREGPNQALFSNSGSGKSQAASLPRHRASLDVGWVLALSSAPEALGKRRKEGPRLDSDPALLIPTAVGPAASAALPQHASHSRGSSSAARPPPTGHAPWPLPAPVLLRRCQWGGWKQPGDWRTTLCCRPRRSPTPQSPQVTDVYESP